MISFHANQEEKGKKLQKWSIHFYFPANEEMVRGTIKGIRKRQKGNNSGVNRKERITCQKASVFKCARTNIRKKKLAFFHQN